MNRYAWHRWFAWYPARGCPVLLRRVECRIVGAVAPDGDLSDYWEYRVA